MSEVPEIRKGSMCRVGMADEGVTEGEFLGYTMLGNENAIVLMTKDGVARFVMMANLSYLDLLTQAPAEDVKETSGRRMDIYYG